jgi:hypothetical protein
MRNFIKNLSTAEKLYYSFFSFIFSLCVYYLLNDNFIGFVLISLVFIFVSYLEITDKIDIEYIYNKMILDISYLKRDIKRDLSKVNFSNINKIKVLSFIGFSLYILIGILLNSFLICFITTLSFLFFANIEFFSKLNYKSFFNNCLDYLFYTNVETIETTYTTDTTADLETTETTDTTDTTADLETTDTTDTTADLETTYTTADLETKLNSLLSLYSNKDTYKVIRFKNSNNSTFFTVLKNNNFCFNYHYNKSYNNILVSLGTNKGINKIEKDILKAFLLISLDTKLLNKTKIEFI